MEEEKDEKKQYYTNSPAQGVGGGPVYTAEMIKQIEEKHEQN